MLLHERLGKPSAILAGSFFKLFRILTFTWTFSIYWAVAGKQTLPADIDFHSMHAVRSAIFQPLVSVAIKK